MRRRTVLRRSAALGAVALAGCTGDGDDTGGNGDGTDTPTTTPTEDGTFSGFGDPSISTTNTGCDEGNAGSASVAFESDPIQITVTGILEASTPCHEASFEGVKYDDENDEIRITISAKDDGSDACQQCIGAIEYEATLGLEGGHPTAVVVKHGTGDDATVVTDVTSGDTAE